MRHQIGPAAEYRIAVLALTWLGGTAGHATGDYLVQPDAWAQHKQDHTHPDTPSNPDDRRSPCQRTRDGHRSLVGHVLTYALTQATTKALAYRAAGIQVSLRAQLAGTVVEGLLHAAIDDGRLLRGYARLVGKLRFHDLAEHGINGRMLLDQAAHHGLQLLAGAVVTARIAAPNGGAR